MHFGPSLRGGNKVPTFWAKVNSCIFQNCCFATKPELIEKRKLHLHDIIIHNYQTSSKQTHKFLPPQNNNCSPFFLDRSFANIRLSSVIKYYIGFLSKHWTEGKELHLALSQGFPNFPDDKNSPGHFLKRQNLSSQLRTSEPKFPKENKYPSWLSSSEILETLLQVNPKCSWETRGLLSPPKCFSLLWDKACNLQLHPNHMEKQADDPSAYFPECALERQGWCILQTEWSVHFILLLKQVTKPT